MKQKTKQAFTLVELLVAMALLITLGLMLVNILRYTLLVWKETEASRELHETARTSITLLTDDLEALYSDEDSPQNILFLLDYDADGRQRLRFIRKIKDENKHPVLRHAGSQPLQTGYSDYYNLKADRSKKLRASGGLAEIVYLFAPGAQGDTELWRGIRSPIGGPDSFFNNANINDIDKVKQQCHSIAKKVLRFNVKCWSYSTTTWSTKEKAQHNGPSQIWDSSRLRLRQFFLYTSTGQNKKGVYPLKIELSIVVQNNAQTRLARNLIDSDNQVCWVENAQGFANKDNSQRFFKIENEWVGYSDRSSRSFMGLKRGLWGTKVVDHNTTHTQTRHYRDEQNVAKTYEVDVPTMVYTGSLFVKIIALPTYSNIPLGR